MLNNNYKNKKAKRKKCLKEDYKIEDIVAFKNYPNDTEI